MIDPKKLKGFQKSLEEKGGDDLFVNASKIEGTLDVRILDPLPNMDGMYALEIPVWWVDKIKIISPELFGGNDVVQIMLDEAKAANEADLNELLAAKNQWGQPKVRKSIEYWIPILALDWKIENDVIVGIYAEDNQPDVVLINKFVRKSKGMILNCKTQLMKAINHEATTRGGHIMFDQEKGFNLILEKTGSGRETTYKASKADPLPMPAQYYGEGKTPDVMNICKAATFTEVYIDAVVGNYLYGEELPEKNDDAYAFPEVRAALASEKKSEPKAKTTRARPGAAAEAQAETPAEEPTKTEAPAPAARPARGAKGSAKPAPARTGRPARNVAADLNDVGKDD